MRRRFVVSCPPIRPSHAIAEFADALIELFADLVAGLRREQRGEDRARERAHRERRQRRQARRGRVALVLQTDLMEHVVRARKLLSKVSQHVGHDCLPARARVARPAPAAASPPASICVIVGKGMYEEAIAEFQKSIELSDDPVRRAVLGHAYAVAGRRGEAQKVINELKDLSKRRYFPPYYIALIYVGLGDKNQALEWLEKAFAERSANLTVLKAEPMFDPIRSDPRFQDLLRRVGLTP